MEPMVGDGEIPVDSSNIASIEYFNDTRTLRVKFHSGSMYDYFNVPESEYLGLKSAESHGKYLHKHIINKYDEDKVG